MYFDVKKALLEIEARGAAKPAIPANQEADMEEKPDGLARLARLAASTPQSEKTAEIIILDAVRAGNRRHGPASRASGLGTIRGYNEIERLRSAGKLHCAKDGLLTVVKDGDALPWNKA